MHEKEIKRKEGRVHHFMETYKDRGGHTRTVYRSHLNLREKGHKKTMLCLHCKGRVRFFKISHKAVPAPPK